MFPIKLFVSRPCRAVLCWRLTALAGATLRLPGQASRSHCIGVVRAIVAIAEVRSWGTDKCRARGIPRACYASKHL
jgi:hypothetical protein